MAVERSDGLLTVLPQFVSIVAQILKDGLGLDPQGYGHFDVCERFYHQALTLVKALCLLDNVFPQTFNDFTLHLRIVEVGHGLLRGAWHGSYSFRFFFIIESGSL